MKKRWETYRQDKTKEPTLAASQQKRVKALKELIDARSNGVGHKLVRIEVDWSNIWEKLEIQAKMPQPHLWAFCDYKWLIVESYNFWHNF